jgi:hypothetical protein
MANLKKVMYTCFCDTQSLFPRPLPQVEAARSAAWNEVLQIEQTPAGN